MDTSLDEKYPLRGTLQTLRWGVRITGIVHTDSSLEFQVQHSSYVASAWIDRTQRYLKNYRNDLVMNWLESIRSNQITSVIKESVCEATKLSQTVSCILISDWSDRQPFFFIWMDAPPTINIFHSENLWLVLLALIYSYMSQESFCPYTYQDPLESSIFQSSRLCP